MTALSLAWGMTAAKPRALSVEEKMATENTAQMRRAW
jgi:hypothetical protein